jgi:hypothetical protein
MGKKVLGGALLVFGAIFMAGNALAQNYALSPDGSAVVRINPVTNITNTSLNASFLTGFGYTTTYAGATTATFASTAYNAGFKNGTGGAHFEALYNNVAALPAGRALQWVQVINTNVPLGGAISPYLDNAGKPGAPFYTYTVENRNSSLPANQLNFYDFSRRDPATLSTTNPITWSANLYPVIYNSTNIEVQNGLSWGWTMTKATVGTTSGVFVNPTPASATVSGVGTNTFSWGVAQPDQSWLQFVGGAFDTSPNTPFKLGTLTFHNGTIAENTGANSVGFDLSVFLSNVPEKNFIRNSTLTLINTLNTSDPIASADQVIIGDYGYIFNVLEGNTASVDLYGILKTDLSYIPSGGISSGAALNEGESFDPVPDFLLTITELKNPSQGGFITVVPLPPGYQMIALPLSILLFYWHRGRRSREQQ